MISHAVNVIKSKIKTIFRLFISACTVVGFCGVIFHCVRSYNYCCEPFRPIRNGDEQRAVEKSISSPDNAFRAILFINEDPGNGAFAPMSCDEYISVIPSNMTDGAAWAQKYRVYTAQCSSPDLVWTSKNELLITFDVSGVTNGAWTKLQGYDQSFNVRVHFAQKPSVK